MTPDAVTAETIAAARLRLVLDEKLGRPTPDRVSEIAAMTAPPTTPVNATGYVAGVLPAMDFASVARQMLSQARAGHART